MKKKWRKWRKNETKWKKEVKVKKKWRKNENALKNNLYGKLYKN